MHRLVLELQSTADLLTVVSDRIARAFNRFVATGAVTLYVSEEYGLPNYRISGWVLGLI